MNDGFPSEHRLACYLVHLKAELGTIVSARPVTCTHRTRMKRPTSPVSTSASYPRKGPVEDSNKRCNRMLRKQSTAQKRSPALAHGLTIGEHLFFLNFVKILLLLLYGHRMREPATPCDCPARHWPAQMLRLAFTGQGER
eukprot:scaffold5093_cov279-Pinguiococcus_pyrenoidosus.AAC.3